MHKVSKENENPMTRFMNNQVDVVYKMAKISTKNIALTIHQLTRNKEGKELEEILIKITAYLAQKRFLGQAPEILRQLNAIINKAKGIVEAEITYKNKLQPETEAKIIEFLKKRYQAKTIAVTASEDRKILGGLKIEAQDEVMDLTLRNKLNQLQDYLIKN